jgi:hypothetical protein
MNSIYELLFLITNFLTTDSLFIQFVVKELRDSHRNSICNCWLTSTNNILHVIYGYVYDVCVSYFE